VVAQLDNIVNAIAVMSSIATRRNAGENIATWGLNKLGVIG